MPQGRLDPIDPSQERDGHPSKDQCADGDDPEPEALVPGEGRRGLAHPEQAADRRDPGQHDGHAREPLHDRREVVVDGREIDLQGTGCQLPETVVLVGQADEVVVHVPEVEDLFLPDEFELPAGEPAEDLAAGMDHVTKADEVALEREHLLEGTLAGIGDDVVLDLVDLVGVAIEDGEVAIDDAVEERPQQEVGTPLQDGLDA